jgi:hypothetical protein
MGVGAQKKASFKSPVSSGPPPSSSATAAYSAPVERKFEPVIVPPVSAQEASLPPSYEASEISEIKPNVLLHPTTENDLDYFHAVAAEEPIPRQPSSPILVMNLFRTTQKHLLPLDERIVLGSSTRQPFYSMLSRPTLTSVDEYNNLTISRRSPVRAFWSTVCISEIRPRLRLLAQGVMVISDITVTRRPGMMADKFSMTWEKARDTYIVWVNTNSGTIPFLDVSLDDWQSLDDVPGDGGGVIRVCPFSMSQKASNNLVDQTSISEYAPFKQRSCCA